MARFGFLGLRRALGVRSCASEARIIAEQVGPSSETYFAEKQRLKVVVAVGGNALIRRGERLTIENQLKAARNDAAPMLKKLMADHSVVLTHGNGPQVGELALERSAATFDVLGAESQGQIGYIFSQAMAGVGVSTACLVTQVVVDPTDAAFQNPTKFVGPVYGAKEADALHQSLGWTMKPDGEYFRRVVSSPKPLEIMQIESIKLLLAAQTPQGPLPIACGGGGVPVVRMGTAYANIPSHALEGMEAVIDKDRCGALLAQQLDADAFLILTDGGGIWRNFGKPDAKEMKEASIAYLEGTKAGSKFPGSMGPKVAAAIEFVKNSPNPDAFAAIGDLNDAHAIFDNQAGTIIKKNVPGDVVWYDRSEKGTKVDRVPRNP
ncbi:arcC [Symbiodinium natans]|uniref:ArcC protein n=1 Tax=Symbiodinium natans TaxID=878477 RepID=A0A812MAS8_9DINO|nr:arcC [Symbiodinium natans]